MNNFVIDTPDNFWQIRWLDKYMEGHKGFIAGGCFKNILSGERVKDIDIFFESESDFQEAVDLFNDEKHQKEDMITSVKIKDNTKTPFEYVSDIEAFENGREFIFKPGVNVIIGKNGSGKSTLLNIISMYALCDKSMCSEMPDEALDFPPIFDDDDKVLDGIDISSDYAGKVFRLLPSAEMNRDSVLKNISNLDLYVNNIRRSYGEKVVLSLESLFNLMFGQKDYTFPIQDLVEYKKKSNAFWIKRIDNLLKYYKRNRITLAESSFEYTVLMDEPDRNLDIDNIMQIYNVLSFHKPQTQIIAIIHNPALIYKLSKLDCVNFIEMTEGYLSKTCIFMSN